MSKLLKLILVLSVLLLLVINYTIIFTPSSVIAIEGIVPEDAPIILPSEESETPADDVGMPEFPENADTDSSGSDPGSGGVNTTDVGLIDQPKIENKSLFNSMEEFMDNLPKILAGFGTIVFVCVILAGGYLFLLSGGDPAKSEKAKKTLTYGILGVLLVGIGLAIAKFIESKIK